MCVLPTGRKARQCCFLLIALFLGGAAASAAAHLRAWHHFRAAEAALTRYHFDEARTQLKIPLRAWPNSGHVHIVAARAARLAGDTEAAEQHLDRCRELRPADDPEVLLEWALLHAASGDLAPVEESLRNQMRPGSPQAPLIRPALVEGYVRLYRLAEAQVLLEDWLSREPNDTQALFLQGCFWQQVQKPQVALASYRRVMELDPERDDARWRLAQCLVKTSAPAEAIGHLEYLHGRHPENKEMAVELARGLFKEARLADARQLLEAVLTEQPDCVPALVERGRLALSDGDAAGAERRLRRAVALTPRDGQALRLLSACLLQQGKRDEAEALRDQLAEMDDDAKRVAEICLRDLGERPNDVALHCELGKRLLRMGYAEAGRAWLLRAVNEDPSYTPARDALNDSAQGPTDAPNRR